MLIALGLVLGAMWLLARWARKPLRGKGDRVIAVLARQQLSRNSSVAVVRVMDRALVVGVSEQGVQLITETELATVEEVLNDTSQPRRSRLIAAADGEQSIDDQSVSPKRTRLNGSALSPQTWRQVVDVVRERTVRR
jgi:flagellar protein FliO/FliZ